MSEKTLDAEGRAAQKLATRLADQGRILNAAVVLMDQRLAVTRQYRELAVLLKDAQAYIDRVETLRRMKPRSKVPR